MKALAIHPEATAEVLDAVVYYEEQVEGLGRELRTAIERTFARLVPAPESCPPTAGPVSASAMWPASTTPFTF